LLWVASHSCHSLLPLPWVFLLWLRPVGPGGWACEDRGREWGVGCNGVVSAGLKSGATVLALQWLMETWKGLS
jgi:hypothetical protein